jgi:hypothetical protein
MQIQDPPDFRKPGAVVKKERILLVTRRAGTRVEWLG